MNRTRIEIVIIIFLALGGCGQPRSRNVEPAPAQPPGSAAASGGSATREALIAARVAAIKNRDLAALEATLHPLCLAAINDQTQPLFKRLFTSELSKPTPEEYTVDYQPYQVNDPTIIQGDFSYPIEPQEEASVRYEPTYHSYITLIWPIAQDQDRWYVIAPVPTPQLLERLAAEGARKDQFRPRARELAAELKDPLRSELLGYLREGRTHTAARKYRQEFGVDMANAELVIEALAETLEESP